MAIEVRSARHEDLAGIQSVIEEWLDESSGAMDSIRDAISGEMGWRYFVAEIADGQIVGVMGLATSGIEPELVGTSKRVAELVNAYVAKSVRGKGIGRALAAQIEATAKKMGYDRLLIVSGSRNREYGYPFWNRRYGQPLRVDEDYFGHGAERSVWDMKL